MAKKTIEVDFTNHEKVMLAGRPAWVEHFQRTSDGRDLYYVMTNDPTGRPTSSWVGAVELTAIADEPTKPV